MEPEPFVEQMALQKHMKYQNLMAMKPQSTQVFIRADIIVKRQYIYQIGSWSAYSRCTAGSFKFFYVALSMRSCTTWGDYDF